MGVSLVKVVLSATWAHLSAPARILFAHMAVIARDNAEKPVYFGGRDSLVLALDGELADDDEAREAQYRRLRRHLEQLRSAGAIADAGHAHRRRRAEYIIQVAPQGGHPASPIPNRKGGRQPTPKPQAHPEPKGGHPVTSQGGRSVTSLDLERGSPSDRKGGHPVTPLGTTEEQLQEEDLEGGAMNHLSAQPSVGARASITRCVICGRPESQCRRFAERHGQHDFTPKETA